jgi:O-antigen/teichoic acid export membrane protein
MTGLDDAEGSHLSSFPEAPLVSGLPGPGLGTDPGLDGPAIVHAPEPGPTGGASEGLGQRAASGVLWMTAQKWVVRIGGLATIAVLTHVLAPADFGVVAAATTILPLVYLLSDLGFSTYIVQADDPDQEVLSTGFWFSVSAGGVLCAGLMGAAPLLGMLFHLPAVVPVLRVMVLSVAFVALAAVPNALLRRRMAFRTLAMQGTVAAVVAQVVAVTMTLAGAGVWALVAQLIVSQGLTSVAACVAARWRPTRHFSRLEFVAMARFGTKVVAVELVALARSWGETAIIAASLGAAGLGYLNIAQRLIQVTQDLSAAALVPVSTVAFARVRDSVDRLRSAYLRALGISYAAVAPLMTFVAVSASLVVPLLFGSGWDRSTPVAQALAVAGILTLGAMLDHGLFYGSGKPGRWLGYAFAVDALTVSTTAVVVRYGLTGVALGFVGVSLVATVARWVLVGRLLGVRMVTVGRPFAAVAVASAGSAAAGLGTMRLVEGAPVVLALAATGVAVLVVHALLVRLITPRVFVDRCPDLRSASRTTGRGGRRSRIRARSGTHRRQPGRLERVSYVVVGRPPGIRSPSRYALPVVTTTRPRPEIRAYRSPDDVKVTLASSRPPSARQQPRCTDPTKWMPGPALPAPT